MSAASTSRVRACTTARGPRPTAGIPTLVLLATEPEELRDANGRAADRMHRVPRAELRSVDGMRHAVFVDLGVEAGAIAADWLRSVGVAGLPDP
jgi:hypothetical protein